MQFNRQPMGWPKPAAPAPAPKAGPGSDRSKLFNPKAFPWAGSTPKAAPEPKKPAEDEPTKRIYEVLEKTATVRAEPDVNSKMKTKKSRGARLYCCEITVNG